MREHFRSLRLVLSVVLRDEPWRAAGSAVFTILAQVAQPLIAFGLKLITDAAAEGDTGASMRAGVILALALGAWSLGGWASFSLRMGFRERSTLALDTEIARLSSNAVGLEHHERPDYIDQMTLLRDEHQQLAAMPDAFIVNLGVAMRFIATVLLLGHVHPLLLLLPLAAVPSIGVSRQLERTGRRLREELTPLARMQQYISRLAWDAGPGKELRVFGLGPELLRRFDEAEAQSERRYRRYETQAAIGSAAGWLVFGAAFIGALVFVAARAASSDATPGDVVLALTLASQLNSEVTGLVHMVGWFVSCAATAGRYRWLLEYTSAQARGAGAPVPDSLRDGVSLENVTFRYPGTDVSVLEDVNLRLAPGSTVAVIGDNGAGKSTLVKLLCRLYEPTTGRITADGIDIREFDVDAWRARLSGGFQDYARFEFLASEAVGVGDLPRIDDARAIATALVRAHADDLPLQLRNGLDTQLGRSFDEGVELSGGQWQKLAIARAMVRDDVLLQVLDEPTAALDAQAEHALFDRFARSARRGAEQAAGITVFVSHRFSTVRMADLIVVVSQGRVVEQGTHAELTALGGLYAELYELQASAYR